MLKWWLNNGKHGQGTHSTKMCADNSAKNTQNSPKLICPICLSKPKSLGFQWKKASLGVHSPCYQLSRQYTYIQHMHIDTHMCFFKPCHVKAKRSSYVSSSHSNCNNLTIFNGAYRLLPLLLNCTKQLHTDWTNAAPSIEHIAACCSFFVQFFVWSAKIVFDL